MNSIPLFIVVTEIPRISPNRFLRQCCFHGAMYRAVIIVRFRGGTNYLYGRKKTRDDFIKLHRRHSIVWVWKKWRLIFSYRCAFCVTANVASEERRGLLLLPAWLLLVGSANDTPPRNAWQSIARCMQAGAFVVVGDRCSSASRGLRQCMQWINLANVRHYDLDLVVPGAVLQASLESYHNWVVH